MSEPDSMKNHWREGDGCHGPSQSAAKCTTANPTAGISSDASSGVVGGANARVPSGSVQSSKCDRPSAATKRRTYFSGMTIGRNAPDAEAN